MPRIENLQPTHKAKKLIVLLLDMAGNKSGSRMAALIEGIEAAFDRVNCLFSKSADVEYKVFIMTYGTTTEKLTTITCDLKTVKEELATLSHGGVRDTGMAFQCLSEWLIEYYESLRVDILNYPYYLPSICFFTDGMPTDDLRKSLEKIYDNVWIKKSYWYCVGIGKGAEDTFKEIEQKISIESSCASSDEVLKNVLEDSILSAASRGGMCHQFITYSIVSSALDPDCWGALENSLYQFECSSKQIEELLSQDIT